MESAGAPGWGPLRHSRGLWEALRAADADVFHSHGLWTDVHRAAAWVARQRCIPHVIGPCGMLMPDAMRRSHWKKWPVWHWFQRRALRDAACILANSEQERSGILALGLGRPVALVPNPIMVPAGDSGQTPARAIPGGTDSQCRRQVLFLGRLHPVKGAMRLLQAWGQIGADRRVGWELVLAGPDEGGYRACLEAEVDRLSRRDSVTFTGGLDHRRKWEALETADLFVLPSDFENFGLAAAEALWAGVPVIATRGTPWSVLPERRAGWWVEPNPDALATVLTAAMALSPEERGAMGRRGREIANAFTPKAVGVQLLALYSWLLGKAEQPEFVMWDQPAGIPEVGR